MPMADVADAGRRMAIWPTTPKAIRARISSYRRILRQEYEGSDGQFGDGYGKRFWLFNLYYLLREDDEVRAYIDWYVHQFPDDHSEVGSLVCWALILRRLGREDEAVYRFVEAIDENLPAVAKVVGDYRGPYGMRGEEVLHFHDLDDQLIAAMTPEERAWLRRTWRSPTVVAMREQHLASGRAWAATTTQVQREAWWSERKALVASFKPKDMPPLSTGSDWLTSGRVVARTRSSKKVICTTPETWTRGAAVPDPTLPHEIVIRYAHRRSIRLRGFSDRAVALQVVQRIAGKILVGTGFSVSTEDAIAFSVMPDGTGPEGAEVVKLPKE